MAHLEVLELRTSRRLGAITAVVSAAVLAVGVWMQAPVAIVIGVAGLGIGFWSLLDRRVKLRIDEVGILYVRWGHTPVQWSEIAAIEKRTFRGVEQVCIVPVQPSLIVERMPAQARWASWIAARVWSCRFVISTAGLEQGTPWLIELMRRYHAARTRPGGA